ncbi:hypothetical protein G6F56_012878 [Rhizopus delemar]|nr:hypothetical protein G6F56_012878 [Rhizopus delemar]
MTEPTESISSISNQSMTNHKTSNPDHLDSTVQQLSCLYLEEDTEVTENTLGNKSEYTYEEICKDFCKVYYKYNDEPEEDDENNKDKECKEDEKCEAKASEFEEPDGADDNNINDVVVGVVDVDEYYDSDLYDNYHLYDTYEESDFYSDTYDRSDYSSDYSYGYIDESDEIWYY